MAVKQNYVTSEIKKQEKKLGKKITEAPGPDSNYSLDYSGIELNANQKEVKFGEGLQFENDLVLQSLGFKTNTNGTLVLSTYDYEAKIADNGEIIRTKKSSKASTKTAQSRDEIDTRDI